MGGGGFGLLGECTDYRRRAIGMHTPTKPPHGGALGPCAYGAIYKHDFFLKFKTVLLVRALFECAQLVTGRESYSSGY